MKITERDVTLIGHGSGVPALHNLRTYTTRRQAQRASNGKHKGIVAVKRLKALTDAQRGEFVREITVILGRNRYNQNRRGYVYKPYGGHYYSDCSSIGMATFRKIGYSFSWLYNTAAIYTGKEFESVPVKIEDGHIMNPEVLKVGDAVLYRGNDPRRPLQIGHVEWVYETPADDPEPVRASETYTGAWPSLYNGKGYYEQGDGIRALKNYPTQIKRVQMLLNWLDDSVPDLVVDGQYGVKTTLKVNTCKAAFGLPQDGRFDADLLARAKEYRKQ